MKLNLTGWKKVSSHRDHSILKNKDGHELKVLHKALSKDAKGQLENLKFAKGGQEDPTQEHLLPGDKEPNAIEKQVVEEARNRMADGGPVSTPPQQDKGPKIDPKKAKEIQDSAMQSGWQPKKWIQNAKEGLSFDNGGKIQKFAEKGFVEPETGLSEDTETADATETPEGVPLPEGGMSPEEVTQDNAETTGPEAVVGFNPNSPSGKEAAAMQAGAVPEQAPQGVQPMDPNSPAAPQERPDLLQQYGNSLNREGQLREKAGNEQAEAANSHVKALDKIHADSQAVLKPMQDEILSIAHDKSEDKIDESAYWKDHSRAFVAIGLALSSIGGQGEAAMNFLNKSIERNIDAQKAIIRNKNDKRQTLLGTLQKQYGDGLVAENMAKASEAASYLAKAQAIAAKSNSPIQQEAVKRMYLDFASKYQAGVEQAAIVHSADKAIQSGDSQGIHAGLQVLDKADPKRAAAIRARYVPGVGIADRPVSRFALQDITAKTNLLDNVKTLRDFISKHPMGTLDQDQKKYISGLALETQGLYRKALGASTSENEQHIIGKIIPEDPASIFTQFGKGSSLRALDDSVQKQLNNLKKQHGLPQTDYNAEQGPETREIGGSTYQKIGPNKWQKIK